MAKIGLFKPKYSKITVGTDENGNETESYSAAKVFAKAISTTTSINTSDAKLYADDSVAETANEFVSGQLTFVGDDIEDAVEADISGAIVDETTGAIKNKDTDNAPYVRFGFLIRRKKNNEIQYRAVIFPKVKFSVPADDYETKGESIVFKSTTVVAEIMRNVEHDWRIKSKWMPSESEAEAWLDENIAPTNA